MFANIYGTPGVSQLVSMLKLEISTTLALLGAADSNKLDETYVIAICVLSNGSS
jgi:isopentenyl diphosphate isomerase/L-lactate dehydrogenase-like FMN-dependent dehydrogenase